MREYPITPIGKPRMTQRDKWAKRPAVLRYFAFKDECLLRNVQIYNCDTITFVIPMPKSWSKKKMQVCDGSRHVQKPDIDNLLKALLDAVHEDDSHICEISIKKVWGYEGKILIDG